MASTALQIQAFRSYPHSLAGSRLFYPPFSLSRKQGQLARSSLNSTNQRSDQEQKYHVLLLEVSLVSI